MKLRFALLMGAAMFLIIPKLHAATSNASFAYQPTCEAQFGEADLNKNNAFGQDQLGDIEGMVNPDGSFEGFDCEYLAKDPSTLQTPNVEAGEEFGINLALPNPSGQPLTRASVWLSYDPSVLECVSVSMGLKLGLIAPGMQDCYPDEGLVKMDASAESGKEPSDKLLKFATVNFIPLDGSVSSTPLSFYGIGNQTNIYTLEGTEEVSILDPSSLGSLLVNMLQSNDQQNDDPSSENNTNGTNDTLNSNEDSSSTGEDPPADANGLRAAAGENGSQCSSDNDCTSGICEQNSCQAGLDDMPNVTSSEWLSLTPTRLRVTSEGNAAMLAWDPLAVAGVAGYNLYYGQTSGRYLHRRTVTAQDSSHIIRNLSIGRNYYFALRALDAAGAETGFSQEVSVSIGNPNSSTAPLVLDVGVTGTDQAPNNPIQANLTGGQASAVVPGETGLQTTMLWLVMLGAVVGTLFALRRQFT